MAPHLDSISAARVRVVDFHNLEWRHLRDAAALAGAGRGTHLRRQAALMRRYEQRLVRESALSLFAARGELEWAEQAQAKGRGERLLVPNLLPQGAASVAQAAWDRRSPQGHLLLYVGKLSFPPNARSLLRFLRGCWPDVLAANPQVRLRVVGDCSDDMRRRINEHPRTEALGFVTDLGPSLAQATAAILPFEGDAGSSLRVLMFALSGVPVIGPNRAFRGIEGQVGIEVDSCEAWAGAVRDCRERRDDADGQSARARAAALHLHEDPLPWAGLYESLLRLTGSASSGVRA
jgi:hypothetical protein